MDKKLDITSTALEKAIDSVKGFVDKLIGPAIEETGLLIQDKARMWRSNNQLKALSKSKNLCEKYNVSTKVISFKLLFPLLEYAGLEEDESMQDKWANLLTNMVDSEQNITNHVFPYLLSQISLEEFTTLEASFNKMYLRRLALKPQIDKLEVGIEYEKLRIEPLINAIDEEIKINGDRGHELYINKSVIRTKLKDLHGERLALLVKYAELENIDDDNLEDFEISNLLRLGLIKSIQIQQAYIENTAIRNDDDSGYLYLDNVNVKVEHGGNEYFITQLGEKFIQACSDRK